MIKKALLVLILVLLSSCGRAGPTATPTPEVSETSTTTPVAPKVEPIPMLLEQAVRFTVQVPPNTPASDSIYLRLLPFYDDWAELARIPMTRNGDGTWSGTALVPQGGLVRYVYDRGMAPSADSQSTRERSSDDLAVVFRFLQVSQGLEEVRDVIARWNDVPSEPPSGTLRGRVRDLSSGKPVWEATVSVGGVHAATYYDGFFQLDDVPAGLQRMTVFTDDGRYRVQSRSVAVEPGGVITADFALEPARQVPLIFRVQVPEDTPKWAAPRITGNIPQLGSWVWYLNGLGPSPLRTVSMTRTGPRQFEAQLLGYEGLYVQYAYTLGALSVGQEMAGPDDGTPRLRSILVTGDVTTVADEVAAWRAGGMVGVEFRVRVPPNTPQGVPVLLDFAGPPVVLHQVGPLEWAFPYYHPPGGQFVFRYRYTLGTGLYGGEATRPDRTEPTRTLIMPYQDIQLMDTVERWRWTPLSTMVPPLAVDFYVAVPAETPQGDQVYLLGSTPEMGGGEPARALEMTRMTESLWYVRVSFDSAAKVSYRFLRGVSRIDDGQERTLEVAYGGQQVLAWVASWQDQEASPMSSRSTFMAGAALDDLWSDEFRSLLPTTLDHLKAQGVEWVDVSQIWNFGRLFPEPILENRSLRGGPLLTPLDDMRFVAGEVKARGMKLLIHPQPNPEMTPGLEWWFKPRPDEWYEAYLPQLERFMLDVAAMAQEVEADMVAVPRVMAVFQNPEYEATYNARMAEIILKMRVLYSGLITSETGAVGPLQYDFHRLLDYQGVYWYEPLDVSDDAPVEEIQAAIEARLDGPYREVFERYGKPLVITQFAYGSYAGAARMAPGGNPGLTEDQPVALELLAQARLYEAFFRAVASRPWIVGMFPVGYHLLDVPLDRDFSMRAKPAEAVAARWYELLSP